MRQYNNRRKPAPNKGLMDRLKDNYDIVLYTIGAVVLLGMLGFPISKQTTVVENNNPQVK